MSQNGANFHVFLQVLCLISLELTFVKVDKGFLRDIITFSDHFICYMLWYCKDKHTE